GTQRGPPPGPTPRLGRPQPGHPATGRVAPDEHTEPTASETHQHRRPAPPSKDDTRVRRRAEERSERGGEYMSFVLDWVCAGYGRTTVLRDVSVEVGPGEVVALIGPNGAGKTPLLRAATGMVRPTRGSVRLGSRELTGAPVETIARAGVAHVPEGR